MTQHRMIISAVAIYDDNNSEFGPDYDPCRAVEKALEAQFDAGELPWLVMALDKVELVGPTVEAPGQGVGKPHT